MSGPPNSAQLRNIGITNSLFAFSTLVSLVSVVWCVCVWVSVCVLFVSVWVGGWVLLWGGCMYNETSLIRTPIVSEVSSFQRLQEWYLGWEKVSCLERCPQFRSVLIEWFHTTCMYIHTLCADYVHTCPYSTYSVSHLSLKTPTKSFLQLSRYRM